jgi:hypothetical protein
MKATLRAVLPAAAIVLGLLMTSAAAAKSEKVTLCHNGQEISISENAVDAHLRNHEGDTLGPCPEPVACPCWTEEGLRGAVDAATASPDAQVAFCDLFVEGDRNEFFATLFLDSMDGFAAADVASFDDFAGCDVDVFDLDVGLEPISMEISVEEASECASIVGAICMDLLP